MKKLLLILVASIILVPTTACNNQTTDLSSDSPSNSSINKPEYESTSQSEEDASPQTITLEADNDYMIISSIDISDCKLEDGYFKGKMTFVSKTTQKYVDEYNDYAFRQIFFEFFDENGDLVGSDVAQNNYIYEREYVWNGEAYVMIRTDHNIIGTFHVKQQRKTIYEKHQTLHLPRHFHLYPRSGNRGRLP